MLQPKISKSCFNAPSFIAGSVFIILSTLFIMFNINWVMALVALTIVLPLGLTSRFFSRKIEKAQIELEEHETKVFSYTAEAIDNSELIQNYGMKTKSSQTFVEILKSRFNRRLHLGILGESMGIASGGVVAVGLLIR